jgi:PAS domain-containing protein
MGQDNGWLGALITGTAHVLSTVITALTQSRYRAPYGGKPAPPSSGASSTPRTSAAGATDTDRPSPAVLATQELDVPMRQLAVFAITVIALIGLALWQSNVQGYRREVRHFVEAARNQVQSVIESGATGTERPDDETIRAIVTQITHTARFDEGKGYLFVYSDENDDKECIAHGGDLAREGQPFGDLTDEEKTIIRELSRIAHENAESGGDHFHEYLFPLPRRGDGRSDPAADARRPNRKIGYALQIRDKRKKPEARYRQWWIGAGVYRPCAVCREAWLALPVPYAWLAILPLLGMVVTYARAVRRRNRVFMTYPAGIVVVRSDDHIVRINESARRFFDVSDSASSMRFSDLLYDYDRVRYQALLPEVDAGKAKHFNTLIPRPEHQHVYGEIEITPVRTGRGKVCERIHTLSEHATTFSSWSVKGNAAVAKTDAMLICTQLSGLESLSADRQTTLGWEYRDKVAHAAQTHGGKRIEYIGHSPHSSGVLGLLRRKDESELGQYLSLRAIETALQLARELRRWRKHVHLPGSVRFQLLVDHCIVETIGNENASTPLLATGQELEQALGLLQHCPSDQVLASVRVVTGLGEPWERIAENVLRFRVAGPHSTRSFDAVRLPSSVPLEFWSISEPGSSDAPPSDPAASVRPP